MEKYKPKLWGSFVAEVDRTNRVVPAIPKSYPSETSGWCVYDEVNDSWVSAEIPVSVYCVDIETVCANHYLALASAYDMVNSKWYGWLTAIDSDELLTFPEGSIGIAHRSTFENSFTTNGYADIPGLRWLCTQVMANVLLHPTDLALFRAIQYNNGQYNGWASFMEGGADTSLAGLYLHFTGKILDKSDVQVFIKGERTDFRADLPRYFAYNFTDVKTTVDVFYRMWDEYKTYDPVFLNGLLERSTPRIPLNRDFNKTIESIEAEYQAIIADVENRCLMIQADHLAKGDQGWDGLDWSLKRDGSVRWVAKRVTPGMKTFASIAKLSWKGQPLKLLPVSEGEKLKKVEQKFTTNYPFCDIKTRRVAKAGSSYKVNTHAMIEVFKDRWHTVERGEGIDYQDACITVSGLYFDNPNNTSKLPKHIVNFFTKGLLPYWENGDLTSETVGVSQLVEICIKISFWKQMRSRLLKMRVRSIHGQLFVCPLTSVNGTVTGRAIDPIWLVLAKFEKGKLGSDLFREIEAGEGKALVYADFDSCQTLIAALIGDSFEHWVKMGDGTAKACSSEFSKAALLGNKKDESTLPYVLAKKANQPYAKGKNSLYSLLFFVGSSKLGVMMGSEDVASKLEEAFRGKRKRFSKEYDGSGMAHWYYRSVEALADGHYVRDGKWYLDKNGTMRSSLLNRVLPHTLNKNIRQKSSLLTAYNAQIQAVDQDMLNFVVSLIAEKARDEGIYCRLVTCVHDAVTFETNLETSKRLSDIFQEAHRTMMAQFLDNLGIDLKSFPPHCFEYSSVDIMKNWSTNKDYTQEWGTLADENIDLDEEFKDQETNLDDGNKHE